MNLKVFLVLNFSFLVFNAKNDLSNLYKINHDKAEEIISKKGIKLDSKKNYTCDLKIDAHLLNATNKILKICTNKSMNEFISNHKNKKINNKNFLTDLEDKSKLMFYQSMEYREFLFKSIGNVNIMNKLSNFLVIKNLIFAYLKDSETKTNCYYYLNVLNDELVNKFFEKYNFYKNFKSQLNLLMNFYVNKNNEFTTISNIKKIDKKIILNKEFEQYIPFLMSSLFIIFKKMNYDFNKKLEFELDFFKFLLDYESSLNLIDIKNENEINLISSLLNVLLNNYKSLDTIYYPNNYFKAVYNNIDILNNLNDFENVYKKDLKILETNFNFLSNKYEDKQLFYFTIKNTFFKLNDKKQIDQMMKEEKLPLDNLLKNFKKINQFYIKFYNETLIISEKSLLSTLLKTKKKELNDLINSLDKNKLNIKLLNKYNDLIQLLKNVKNLEKVNLYSKLFKLLFQYTTKDKDLKKDGTVKEIKAFEKIKEYFNEIDYFVNIKLIFKKESNYYNFIDLIINLINKSKKNLYLNYYKIFLKLNELHNNNFLTSIINNFDIFNNSLKENKENLYNILTFNILRFLNHDNKLYDEINNEIVKNSNCDLEVKLNEIMTKKIKEIKSKDIKESYLKFFKNPSKIIIKEFNNDLLNDYLNSCKNNNSNNQIGFYLIKNKMSYLNNLDSKYDANADKIIRLVTN